MATQKILLADLLNLEQKVEIVEGVFLPVRALTFAEIATIIMTYKEAAMRLYAETQNDTPNYPLVLAALPTMVADIICMGADLEDQRADALRLPPGTQLQLLEAIWSVSVPEPKKLLESLSKLMVQARRLAASGTPPSL